MTNWTDTNKILIHSPIHRYDFDLFDYDIKEYLQYARADEVADAVASGVWFNLKFIEFNLKQKWNYICIWGKEGRYHIDTYD